MLFNFELALIDVVLGNITHPAIINAVAISIILIAIFNPKYTYYPSFIWFFPIMGMIV